MPGSRKFSARMLEVAFVFLVLPMVVAGASEAESTRMYPHSNWQIQSSCEVKATGEQISSVGYVSGDWHHADAPTTGKPVPLFLVVSHGI